MLDHAIYKSKLSSKYLNMQFQLYEHPVYKDWFGIISVGQLLIPAEPILTPKFGYVYQLSDLILLNTKYTPIYSIMPASIGRFSLNHQHVTIVADESAQESYEVWHKMMLDKQLIEDDKAYARFVLEGEPSITLTTEGEWFPDIDWFFNALTIDSLPLVEHRFFPRNITHVTGFVFDKSIVDKLGQTFTFLELKALLQPYYDEELAQYMQYWQLLEQTKQANLASKLVNVLSIPYVYNADHNHTHRIYQEYMTKYGIVKSVDEEILDR